MSNTTGFNTSQQTGYFPALPPQALASVRTRRMIAVLLDLILVSIIAAVIFLGLGFLGGRLDHQLAAMSALARHSAQQVVLLGGEDICFLCPPALELDLAAGTRVSLFPMGPVAGLRSEGLRWSVAGLDFAPCGRIGTSNEALGGPMRIAFDAPGMLVILPSSSLAHVAQRLPKP